jgi:AraC family transcriptional regulator
VGLGLQPGSLARLFHRRTGTTVSAALAARRLRTAQDLLLRPELSVQEVALASGFVRVDSFNRVFRSATGQSPSRWRRMGVL